MKRSKLVSSLSLLVILCMTLGSCLDDGGVNPYQQLQEDVKKIDAYLAANPPTDPTDIIVRDASGIRMVVTEMGSGIVPPTPENLIQVSYVGRLLKNGQLVDPPFDQDNSLTFTLAVEADQFDVIRGWKTALFMMTEGTKATVYIPSGLAYGTSGKGSIPDNAILVFDLELLIVNTDNEAAQRLIDNGKINAELEAVPNVVNDPSGISYILEPIGTGIAPTLYDQVTIRYTGSVLGVEEPFATGVTQGPDDGFSSMVVNYIHGLTVGLQIMHQGDKATFYIPSAMAYGPSAVANIPANSVLVFEVELLEVIPNQQ
jgi:FKBP-type peptidyl-prolyl cis-trans isomerase